MNTAIYTAYGLQKLNRSLDNKNRTDFAVLFLFLNNIIDVALYSRTFYRTDRIKSYK